MSSEVLSPSTGQTIVRTDDHGHRHGGHQWEETILREQLANFRNLTDRNADGFRATAKDACDGMKQVSDLGTSVVAYAKDAAATAFQIEGRAALEAAKNANLLGIQATANFNAIQVEQVKNASAAVLLATQNQAAILAAQAACCCELKELITADGNATRALINANVNQELRDKVAALEVKNAALFTAKLAPITP